MSFILRQMDLTRAQAFQAQEELERQQQVVHDLAQERRADGVDFRAARRPQSVAAGMIGISLLVAVVIRP